MSETHESLGGLPTEEELQIINRMSRRPLKAEEVFTFSVVLCDNEVDRDNERFSVEALKGLAKLYVGKTGIFDHSMHGRDQCARIFAAAVETEDRLTTAGERYHCLKARAYMPRTESNRDLMLEIDAGIKKEVSVGCATAGRTCSVCGKDLRAGPCGHRLGRYYTKNGAKVKCHAVLSDPTDAYEWSFVAVPAQRAAGVTKAFRLPQGADWDAVVRSLLEGGDVTLAAADGEPLAKALNQLRQRAEEGECYRDELRKEAVRLTLLTQPAMDSETAHALVEPMELTRLKAYTDACRRTASAQLPLCPQLAGEKTAADRTDDAHYLI